MAPGGADEGGAGPRDGADLFISLPDDVLSLVSSRLRPRDLCTLSGCCRRLRAAVAASEKSWLAQCLPLGGPPLPHLRRWRDAAGSYRAVCRFLSAAAPLLGVWVHQNPELGNVVVVLWGFLSVVGVRVIPQELGPRGLDGGPLLWAPVFEVLAGTDGEPSCFFLHGRADGACADSPDALYAGTLQGIDLNCNVLFLEVDVRLGAEQLPHDQSFSAADFRNPTPVLDTNAGDPISFHQLAFGDRRRLLDLVSGRARLKVPQDLVGVPLFPHSLSTERDLLMLAYRWSSLISLHRVNCRAVDLTAIGSSRFCDKTLNEHGLSCSRLSSTSKRRIFSSVAENVRYGLKQFMRSSSMRSSDSLASRNGGHENLANRHVQLYRFLNSGDSIGLSLSAENMELTCYHTWPLMHDNWFALYKLPLQASTTGLELSGMWGGTFGWPPGQLSEGKPGKALFLLMLSYEEAEGKIILIATKILEGTHYVLHPNGSTMFIAKVDEPSAEPFPWQTDGKSPCINVEHSFAGIGIASGYGFRYPGSKPGSLYVLQDGLLAFVWKESNSVLTMKRLDLEDHLRKGERVPTLPPVANFAYLTKSYSNVFAGFHN